MGNQFLKDRQKLNDKLILYVLSDGKKYNTGKLSRILKVCWDTAHKHLSRLEEKGFVKKTRYKKQFNWQLVKESDE